MAKDSKCNCSCHPICGVVGEEFVPSHERRAIKENEYARMLMSEPRLLMRFGVCGYQHPLSPSSNTQTLVTTQLLKERLIFSQREVAAAVNWCRLLQFYFPPQNISAEQVVAGTYFDDTFTQKAITKLCRLNRENITHISSYIKCSLACERVMDDIETKFNTSILPLGKKSDIFLSSKAGLTIQEHAKNILSSVLHKEGLFKESWMVSQLKYTVKDIEEQFSDVGKKLIQFATDCVTGKKYREQYNTSKPFLVDSYESSFKPKIVDSFIKTIPSSHPSLQQATNPSQEEEEESQATFYPIPMFGIKEPTFDAPSTYEDNTATKCSSAFSSFKILDTGKSLIDASVSRKVISLPRLLNGGNSSPEINCVRTKHDKFISIYRNLRKIHEKEIASDKPRKTDSSPWSSKNTGQSGRSTIEFSPNSIIVIAADINVDGFFSGINYKPHRLLNNGQISNNYNNKHNTDFGPRPIFLLSVETQRNSAQNDIVHPRTYTKVVNGKEINLIEAPDISPIYRSGRKPSVISLKR